MMSLWIGSLGVSLLLIAFVASLLKKWEQTSFIYLVLNCVGSFLAAIASWMIEYYPFVVLELVWFVVAFIKLIQNHLKKKLK